MNWKRLTTAAVFAAVCSVNSAYAQQDVKIGTEGAFPPFNFVDANGQPQGFEVDLGYAICKAAKLNCTFTAIAFDGLIPALKAKKIDAIIASMNITDERKKVITFVGPYYVDPPRFVGKSGSSADVTPAGLKGRTIGVASGTISESYVRDVAGTTAKITSYPSLDNALLDLSADRVELVLDNAIALSEGFLKKPEGKEFEFIGPALSDTKHFGIGPGIGIRQNEKATASALASGLKAVQDSGEFKTLSQKYFGMDISPKKP
ncbi:transporter substrate-binding domain-containing protein [Mesorhizobium sp. M1060]|uniref:transporter substrate-binding domain-containing protein n=1 Tax=unclassified Mesorhizobium TaxID=325217 RepID=UPI0003CF75B6|nr:MULTISPECIES: transporter substrate-binding domain-containing protein [unclassified Mesorhizobium]ESW91776.1 ABC transporter substrate-binding protein [Mesorhizobium sp. LSJC269B00]ESX52503.1 ABC transporter substrate-binding protein [Mesorhizobium sp. LSHC426A00]ESX58589.1 ABC transporter substrate-binding protein [Mesorhizobium sp. LSHC424B00]ESX76605.1 hypothetical protein X758_02585 [Mesorhizobium sp. LSHC416B00]ESZ10064.1 ABC transporter substrate-binding protein [Mesorhizobium sp. L2C